MRSRWSEEESAQYAGLLGERVYTSRLLGSDPTLVIHGGGNTSVKLETSDLFGAPVPTLYVKGSGSDLADVRESDFAPVRLEHLRSLVQLPELSDVAMAEQLRLACTSTDAPAPSVEAILHAVIPDRYVDHTHADAVLTVTNTPSGRKRIEEIYGDRVIVVDYVMPGFALARQCAQQFSEERTDATVGMVLLRHGVFSFGTTARESYERMIELVSMAEDYLRAHEAWDLPEAGEAWTSIDRDVVVELRARVSERAGRPMILTTARTSRTKAFVDRADLGRVAGRGPMTPDHAIRTKRVPLVGRDIAGYALEYTQYFERYAARSVAPLTMLDPAPRVILDPDLGLLTAGGTPREAAIAHDIAVHTLDAIERAEMLDAWDALPEADVFDVEYWDLEQAKLRRDGSIPPFAGRVALVTGAASGIGHATAALFRRSGAAVVALDIDRAVEAQHDGEASLGIRCDVTDWTAVDAALDAAVGCFGGIDILVLNAGVFPPSARIEDLRLSEWREIMAVNLDANLGLLQAASGCLAGAPDGGCVVVNASKNVPAPGPGAAAYSASKAALTQLARVATLEWGPRGVRVNVIHPNAVFDTGVWDAEKIATRAENYGLTEEQYRTNNLLGVEVSRDDVAEVIVALCSQSFAKTTGAQVPVDGGNERVV